MENCYKHQNLPATRNCRRCNRGLCDMCQMFQSGESYCTTCFEIVRKSSAISRPGVSTASEPVVSRTQSKQGQGSLLGILKYWKLAILIAIVVVGIQQKDNVVKLYQRVILGNIQKIQDKQTEIKTAMLLPETKNDLMTIASRLKLHKRINEIYPSVDMFEIFLKENMATEFKMGGGEKDVTVDSWGSKFHYELRGKGFYLSSYGPDKQPNTEDDIEIIETE